MCCCSAHESPWRKGMPGLAEAEQLKFKTVGMHVHGIGGYYLYVADPTLPGNANLNLECLHLTLLDLQRRSTLPIEQNGLPRLPSELTIQVDGASDNKSQVVFMYAEWLVRMRVFASVVISFLLVGHTHNDADQDFGPLTFTLRKRFIKQLPDYLEACRTAYKKPPQQVHHVQSVHDFVAWLKGIKACTPS